MDYSTEDLALINARVRTLDPSLPLAEGLSIRQGRITELLRPGQEPKKSGVPVRRIDCRGRTVLPGFIDPHFHLLSYIHSLLDVDLSPEQGIHCLAELTARLAEAAGHLPPGAWLTGRGYDEFHLAEGRHPTRADLDRAAPDHPVKLTHRSGHAHVLNSRAMALVGLRLDTPDPPEGMIDRDLETGEPTGLLFGLAGWLAERIPALERPDLRVGVLKADGNLLSLGLTCLGEATFLNDEERWRAVRTWQAQGLWTGRVSFMFGWQAFEAILTGRFSPESGCMLRPGGVKLIVSRLSGRQQPTQSELEARVRAIHRAGWAVVVHAVEEPDLEAACRALERAGVAGVAGGQRHRIEHCAQCPPELARRLAAAGITVVSQPSFLFRHGDRYLDTIPQERQRSLYPFKTLLAAGVDLAGSSDCPISPPGPLTGIRAAMDRRSRSGRVINPEERLKLDRALELYTSAAARALGLEQELGSLSPGKRADLVVWDQDPIEAAVAELADIKVRQTFINGRQVWPKQG